jgi:uncharacterized protein
MEKISVKNLIRSEMGKRISFEINESLKDLALPEELEGKKLVGKLVLTRLDETILVEGDFVAGIVLICDRCLDNYKGHIPFHLEREYNLNRSDKSLENNYVDKLGDIDLSEAVREEIILSIPMRNICSEKCMGICAGCGINLNREECQCNEKIKVRNKKKE